MISLAIWLTILWVCFGVGADALKRLRANAASPTEEIPFAVALGMGVLAYLVLAIGLLGHLDVWLAVALIGLLALLARRPMVRLARQISLARSGIRIRRWSTLPLALFFVTAGGFTVIGALAPATGSDYDGLVYHLAIPKVYIGDGQIHPIPWLSHSNFPFTIEMLYLLGLLLRDQSLAKLFHFAYGWLTVCAIFAFGRRWAHHAGWLGAAIFAAIPLVAWEMTSAYNELAFALYTFLTIYALIKWREEMQTAHSDSWLWVGAIMCGLALGVKMLAVVVLLFALGALSWALVRGPDRAVALKRIFVFIAIAVAVACPWYLKSYLWTGNPVYPFFYQVFGGAYWSQERADAYTQAQKAFGLGKGPLAFAALPWNLTMRSRWFFDQPNLLRPFNVYVMTFGPLLLGLLPSLLLTGPIGIAGRTMLWFALTYVAIWFGLTQNGRYLAAVLPSLSACAGLASYRLLARRGITAVAVAVALALGLLSGAFTGYVLSGRAVRVVLGLESPSAYLNRVSPLYAMSEVINKATPPNARILVLGDEPRCFYLDRHYLLGNHAEIFSPADLASPSALLSSLKRMEVTHLVLHSATLRDMSARSGAIETLLADLHLAGEIRPLGIVGALSLWQITDGKGESPQ